MLIKSFPSRFLKTNTYLAACDLTRNALLIDPGLRLAEVRRTVERENLKIVAIVNTHTHVDHLLGNHRAKALFGAPLMVHEAESKKLTRHSPAAWLRGRLRLSPPPDRTLLNGDILEVGSLRFEVIHTPGHSPGGICLRHKKTMFTGDTLFRGSIGRTDFKDADFDTLAASITEKLFILSDDIFCYPGHGQRTSIGDERRYNIFVRMRPEQMENMMMAMMKRDIEKAAVDKRSQNTSQSH